MISEVRDVIKEVKQTEVVYKAVDGREFVSETDCTEYEKALRKVVNEKVIKDLLTVVSESDMFNNWCGSEEWDYAVVKLTKGNYNDVKLWFELNGGYKGNYTVFGETYEFELSEEYIGKTVIFMLGEYWHSSMSYDDVRFLGTTEGFIKQITEVMTKRLTV